MFLDLVNFVEGLQGEYTFFLFDDAQIWHAAYKWFEINTNIFPTEIIEMLYVLGLRKFHVRYKNGFI